MGEYTNCLLQGYGVLPSAPTRIHISNINTDYAIVHWATPKTLGDTVKFYNLHYRLVSSTYDNEYRTIPRVHPPYILEHLQNNNDYEVFVEAVNVHGVGEPSTRIVFKTQSKVRHFFILPLLNTICNSHLHLLLFIFSKRE